jgi:phage terminase large subunit-like protein
VEWSPEASRWVRRYRIAWLEVARKNGKSELLAGIALVLLVADDEEGAEVYGCAYDKEQAGKVFRVAERMVELSPVLARRLKVYRQAQRIVDERTGSWYEVVPADELGNVGHNPHGIVFDEVWTQRTAELWNAMRSAMGTRDQALMVAATTAGRDEQTFARAEHDYCVQVLGNPRMDPRRFVYLRAAPPEADWHDEEVWRQANPALGQFLSVEALRDEHREALASPAKEQAFRQFRLNQWTRVVTRWLPVEAWHATAGMVVPAQLVGRLCHLGLDLAAVSDLASLCAFFPPADDNGPAEVLWWHWTPEANVPRLVEVTAGEAARWIAAGWLTVTDGDVIDYDAIHSTIAEVAERYRVAGLGLDRWNSTGTTNWLSANLPRLEVETVAQTYAGLSAPMKELERLISSRRFHHGGNPVAGWCFTSCEVKADTNENVRPVKPSRSTARHRIDAVVAASMAVDGWLRHPTPQRRPTRAAGF